MPDLWWLLLIPFLSSVVAFIFPNRRLAFVLGLLPLALLLYYNLDWIGSKIQYKWLPTLSIEFYMRVDGLSLLFLFLTALIIPIALLAIRKEEEVISKTFYGTVLLLQGLLFGFFMARDLVFFALFWEAMLLPLYFIISVWGGERKQSAALQFLIYMIAGSALMIVAVLSLYFADNSQTFNFDLLTRLARQVPYAGWVCAIFLLAFAVKTPLFPFHAWLPDAYCQAPTAGTILLAGLLSKAGIYGILRIGIGFFPELIESWSSLLLGFAIAGVFYGGLAAWMQEDFKRLIAYSSLSHVNFILAGLFIWQQPAQDGAILQALNHGVTITALFLVAGWLEVRLGSTGIDSAKGMAKSLPQLCWLTLFFVLSNVALPGMNNFVGELMILFGLFKENPWLAALLSLTVILSVLSMLRWMQKIYFREPEPLKASWIDIKAKEFMIAAPLIFLVLWMGIYPSPVLKQIQRVSSKIEEQKQ
jgi:NADH-quinone oxidoreductase subunit M